jgi:hypothetical protein
VPWSRHGSCQPADQDGHDQVGSGDLDGPKQGIAIHRVDNRGTNWWESLRQIILPLKQSTIPLHIPWEEVQN